MVYQHPLAYLLGLEGIALLRAFAGEYGRGFTAARLAEVRDLLDAAPELGHGAATPKMGTTDGYRVWARSYDAPGNQMIDLEQPVVREILDGIAPGAALDVACGTGRHSEYLAGLGHEVTGVDTSLEMLAKARAKVQGGDFHEADLHDLPFADDRFDVVVCALALTHVPDLAQALAELVRVLRPGGHLVVSDSRPLICDAGLPLVKRGHDGNPGYMPTYARRTSDYLKAALPLGLEVRRCEEPRRPFPLVDQHGVPPGDDGLPPVHVRDSPPDIWALHRWCTEAINAAYRDTPVAIVWHFQLVVD